MESTNKRIMLQGEVYTYDFQYTQEQVNQFAVISGDNNPIHLDAAYAANTPFKKPIVHGILSMSIFSKYFGTIYPGEGTVYLKQIIEFLRPTYPDTQYQAIFTIKEIVSSRNKAVVDCKVIDSATGKPTMRGEAEIMHKELIK
ncbi:MAG: MaoC family dehydratase [Bacteroidota bacterium]|nr:MaoC family dehydratase [Bacteroidota bacterium]